MLNLHVLNNRSERSGQFDLDAGDLGTVLDVLVGEGFVAHGDGVLLAEAGHNQLARLDAVSLDNNGVLAALAKINGAPALEGDAFAEADGVVAFAQVHG